MAKKSHSAALVVRFASHLNSLEKTRGRVEHLTSVGQLAKWDLEKIYEALYLSAYSEFEVLLEEVFFCLLLKPAPRRLAVPRIRIDSHVVGREIVLQGEDYINWLPYGRTENLASIFFRGGRPFIGLTNGDKSELKTMLIIRNAIAHRSTFANEQFRSKVVGSTGIPPSEKTPARYLKAVFRTSPVQTRFEMYSGQMLAIAKKLCL